MSTDAKSATGPKVMYWIGWVITALPILSLVMSAIMKFVQPEFFPEEFKKLGWDMKYAVALGVVEIVCVILYIIPRTSVLGAILITGYLGGAVATHLRVDTPYFGPIILGVLVWLGIFFRDARLRALLLLPS